MHERHCLERSRNLASVTSLQDTKIDHPTNETQVEPNPLLSQDAFQGFFRGPAVEVVQDRGEFFRHK